MIRFLLPLLLATMLCGSATASSKNKFLVGAAGVFTALVHKCLYDKKDEFQSGMTLYVAKQVAEDPQFLTLMRSFSEGMNSYQSPLIRDQGLQCPMVSVILPALKLPHRDVDIREVNAEIFELMFKNVPRKK